MNTSSPSAAIGPYQITARLGSGPHGETLLAMNTVRKQAVALKLIHSDYFSETGSIDKFLKGAAALVDAGLVHPQIAWPWEAGYEEGFVFLAARLIEGMSLEEKLRQEGSLDWEEAVYIIRRVGRALEFAHERNLAHGDVKPSNVVLSQQHGAALTDFGLLGLLQACCPSAGLAPHYPIAGAPAAQASTLNDQYALACLVVEMITGLGFSGVAVSSGANQPATIQWPAGLPTVLKNVLRRALSADPGRRYSSLARFTDELEKAIFQTRSELAANRSQRLESEANARRLAVEQERLDAEEAVRLAGVEQVRRELEAELKAQAERVQSVQGEQADQAEGEGEQAGAVLMPAPIPAEGGSGAAPAAASPAPKTPPAAPARGRKPWRAALVVVLLAALAWAGWQLSQGRGLPLASTPTASAAPATSPAPPTLQVPAVVPASATPAPTRTPTSTSTRAPTSTRRPTQTPQPSDTVTPTQPANPRPTITLTRTPKDG